MENRQQQENNNDQQQERKVSPAAAIAIHTMTAAEKAKYFGVTGLLTLIPTEIIGMGGMGLAAALVAGGLAAYWSEEVRDGIIDKLPAPKSAKSRNSKLEWLLTGRTGGDVTQEQENNKPFPEVSHVEVQTENGPVLLPVAPAFKDMKHLITKDKLVLCYSVDGPVYGTVEDLLSMAVVGKPGKGKTVSLMYYVAMLLKSGAEVFIWDPHGVMGELAILNNRSLANMPATAKVTYLDRKEEIIDSVPTLQQKLVERDEEYRRDKKANRNFVKGVWQKPPLLLLADELPVIALYEEESEKKYKQLNRQRVKDEEEPLEFPSMTLLVQRFVLEARKWRCFFIGSGQSTDAQVLPTRVVENMSSRIVFFSSDRRARMAGLEQEAIKEYLPLIRRAGPGTMIFDCSRMDEPVIGAIPNIDTPDLMALLATDTVKYAPADNNLKSLDVIVPTIKDQNITLTYADLMTLINGQNTVSGGVSNVSNYVTQKNAGSSMETSQETSLQANPDKIITDVFPVTDKEQEAHSPSTEFEKEVPEWKRKQVQAMKEAGYPDRDIAALVKLTGRKYKLYQECLVFLGYKQQDAK